MQLLTPIQTGALRDWFLPDRPGPLVGLHVIHTGHGACFADRWPNPRALFIATAANGSLAGEPAAAFLRAIRPHLSRNFVDAPAPWAAALRTVIPALRSWDRVIYRFTALPSSLPASAWPVRRLVATDAYALWGLSAEASWITKTWGGPAGLAASGMAWAAFDKGRVVAVACTFFVGDRYEEIGVVTEAAYRRQGLSTACAAALCADIIARGRQPSWTTSSDNQASRRVAEKLGFVLAGTDVLYPIDIPIPG